MAFGQGEKHQASSIYWRCSLSSTDLQKPIALQALPKFLESRFGKRVAYGTVFRWVRKGIAGIKLRSIYFAGSHFVTEQDVDEFLAAVSKAKSGGQALPSTAETAVYRKRQKARASALGI
jgi:hypothetical protein